MAAALPGITPMFQAESQREGQMPPPHEALPFIGEGMPRGFLSLSHWPELAHLFMHVQGISGEVDICN